MRSAVKYAERCLKDEAQALLDIIPKSSLVFAVASFSTMFSGISYTNVGYPACAIGFETSTAEVDL